MTQIALPLIARFANPLAILREIDSTLRAAVEMNAITHDAMNSGITGDALHQSLFATLRRN